MLPIAIAFYLIYRFFSYSLVPFVSLFLIICIGLVFIIKEGRHLQNKHKALIGNLEDHQSNWTIFDFLALHARTSPYWLLKSLVILLPIIFILAPLLIMMYMNEMVVFLPIVLSGVMITLVFMPALLFYIHLKNQFVTEIKR